MKACRHLPVLLAVSLNCFGKKPGFLAEYEVKPVYARFEKATGKPVTAEQQTQIYEETKTVLLKRLKNFGLREIDISRSPSGNYLVKAVTSNPKPTAKFAQTIFRTGAIELRFCDEPLTQRAEEIFNTLPEPEKRLAADGDFRGLAAKIFKLGNFPRNKELLFSYISEDSARRETLPSPFVLEPEVQLTGNDIATVYASSEEGYDSINFETTDSGRIRFEKATAEDHRGKRLAIVFDKRVLSAPQIMEPIRGGQGKISGGFSLSETHDIVNLLKSGSLPVDLEVHGQRVQSAR